MTNLFLFIKHHCPWIWRMVEGVNGGLFGLLYPDLYRVAAPVLAGGGIPGYRFAVVEEAELAALSAFLEAQPAACLAYFAPHPFGVSELERLFRNKAYLLMKAVDAGDGSIVGYFFLRCFFVGRAFHGLIVDSRARNKGVGSSMWALSLSVCRACGLRMFATVSARNVPSMRAAGKGTSIHIAKELADDYLLIECKPRKS